MSTLVWFPKWSACLADLTLRSDSDSTWWTPNCQTCVKPTRDWNDFTNHTVSPYWKPDHCRPIRTITHADERREVFVENGEGRFQVADMPELLTIYVHLLPVTTTAETVAAERMQSKQTTLKATVAQIWTRR